MSPDNRGSYQSQSLILKPNENLSQVPHFQTAYRGSFEVSMSICARAGVVIDLVEDLDTTSDVVDGGDVMTG
jgi:hypothetical protein